MSEPVTRYTIMGSLGVAVRQDLNYPILEQGTVLVLASAYDALQAQLTAVQGDYATKQVQVEEVRRQRDEWMVAAKKAQAALAVAQGKATMLKKLLEEVLTEFETDYVMGATWCELARKQVDAVL